jgi:hypothetical protein
VSIETSSCAVGSFKDRGIIDFLSLMINHLRSSLRSFFVLVYDLSASAVLRELIDSGAIDPLRSFSEECREELRTLR